MSFRGGSMNGAGRRLSECGSLLPLLARGSLLPRIARESARAASRDAPERKQASALRKEAHLNFLEPRLPFLQKRPETLLRFPDREQSCKLSPFQGVSSAVLEKHPRGIERQGASPDPVGLRLLRHRLVPEQNIHRAVAEEPDDLGPVS